jgi:hypothetical protein
VTDQIVKGKETTNAKPKLYEYIVNQMPELIVKLKLDIWDSDNEKERSIKSEGEIHKNIIDLIVNNGVFPIPKDASLINNLNNYVFKYYSKVFELTIPKMKAVIDNYSRYILRIIGWMKER